MNVALYCSDHAAPTKSSVIYFKWMAIEMEEYYQQGDLERKLDFTVSPFFDRATCNPFKFQLGYIDVISIPLYETWCGWKENMYETLITNGVEPNRRMLVQKIDETKAMAEQQPQGGQQQKEKPAEVSKDEEAAPAQPENIVSPRSDKGGQQESLASNRNSDKNQND